MSKEAAQRDLEQGFDELVRSLQADVDGLTDRVVSCFRAEIPVYAALPEQDLRPGVRSNVERAIKALERGGDPTAAEVEAGRLLGEMRARQGLPVESVLQAHRLGVREALAVARASADAAGIGADVVLELATRAWDWIDAITLGVARGHREQELDLASQSQQQRAHLLRALLHSGLDEPALRAAALTHGIEPRATYAPLFASGPADVLSRLERQLRDRAADAGATLLAAPLDGGLAAVIAEGPAEEIARMGLEDLVPVVAVVGAAATPAHLTATYGLARRAVEAARALGRAGLVSLSEVSMYAAVLGQPEIGAVLRKRYVAPLEAEGEFGLELLTTLESWFEHGMRTDETAAALPVHPNTLRHRLRRVEALTGMSLSTTTARFELWWALATRRLVVD